MKKRLYLLIILILTLSLSSCAAFFNNQQSDDQSDTDSKSNEESVETKTYSGKGMGKIRTSGSATIIGSANTGGGGLGISGFGSGITSRIGSGTGRGSKDNPLPTFNWPPPKPSAFSVIDRDLLTLPTTNIYVGKVERILRKALILGGYFDVSYYAIESQPDAFVMVTRLEKINDNATPVEGKDRWVTGKSNKDNFSLTDYFQALFYAKPGKYRIIVFIVSAESIQFDKKEISAEFAKQWISDGSPSLTRKIRKTRFTNDHQITALVYEFEKNVQDDESDNKDSASLILPGIFQTRTHLEKAGIWKKLTNSD